MSTSTDVARAPTTSSRARPSDRRRAECFAQIQTDAVQLALDLLVREPDIEGFFGAFTKTLVEGVREPRVRRLADRRRSAGLRVLDGVPGRSAATRVTSADWDTLTLPRESMSAHLFDYKPGWSKTVDYTGDDPRLPEAGSRLQPQTGVQSLAVAPLVLGDRNLGLDRPVDRPRVGLRASVGVAVLEAMARQATLALHQSRLAEQRRRRAPQGDSRGAQSAGARHPRQPRAGIRGHPDAVAGGAARSRTAVTGCRLEPRDHRSTLARSHMTEARRSVCALRPNVGDGEDVATALKRIADVGRRTSDRADRCERRRAAAIRRRGRTGDDRHRAGSADQRRPPFARAAHHDLRVNRPLDRLAPVGGRRWPRDCRGASAPPASA